MRLSSVVRLYRVRLRARLVQELFAVAGIAIGVALLFASHVASTSLNGSVQQLNNGIVGGQMRFQLTARDSSGFDERLLGDVQRVPGVAAAAPVLEESVNVIGPSGRRSVDLVGTDPRLARLGGSLVRGFYESQLGRVNALMLPASIMQTLGVGSLGRVMLQIGARTVPALLVPELPARGSATLADNPIAIAPLDYAQELTGMTRRLTSIYIQPRGGHDRMVEAGLEHLASGRLNVRPADFNATLFSRAAGPTNQSTALFSAISALVGFLFAFNALLLTVPQRRSLIADLRLDGYTRRMIVEVLLFDALLLGVLASVIGLLLGELISIALFNANPGYLSFAFPIGSQRIVTWQSVALGVGGGLLAAFIGVLTPLRGDVFASLGTFFGARARRPFHDRSLWLSTGAIVCLAGTTLILLFALQMAIVAVVSLTVALLLLLPTLLDVVVFAFDRLQRRIAVASPYLAVIELRSRSNQARSIAIAATGAIAVFGSVSVQGARNDLQSGLDASARGIDSLADVWVTPAGESNSFATTSFSSGGPVNVLRRLPGVGAVRLYRGSFLDWGERRVWVVAPPRVASQPIAPSQIVRGNPALATMRLRESGWIVLSQKIATERHLRIGQSFTLPSSRPTVFRVAALSTNLGWSPGAIVLNAEDYARAWGSGRPSAYQIELAPGADAAAVAHAVRSALGPQSGLQVQTRFRREELHYAQAAQGLSRLTQIRTLVLIAAVLAMAAAMGAMIWQRRVRLADMKVDGFGRGVLWGALLWESALLLSTGCSIGAVFGIYGQLVLSRTLATVDGFPVTQSIDVPAAFVSFALITAVAVAIVAVPGYIAARVHPSVSLQD
jgi:putative ABC transport system permease protein